MRNIHCACKVASQKSGLTFSKKGTNQKHLRFISISHGLPQQHQNEHRWVTHASPSMEYLVQLSLHKANNQFTGDLITKQNLPCIVRSVFKTGDNPAISPSPRALGIKGSPYRYIRNYLLQDLQGQRPLFLHYCKTSNIYQASVRPDQYAQ